MWKAAKVSKDKRGIRLPRTRIIHWEGAGPLPGSSTQTMTRILLAGKDWKTRALLRAQLIEEGLDVEAHETVAEALASLEESPALPSLFLADLSSSDNPAGEADLLAAWATQVPVWLIAGKSFIVAKDLKSRGFEMILFKPVDVGELVEQIKQRTERA